MFIGKVTIAPRLVLQARRFVGVDRARIPVPFTTGRDCFASVAALLLQPRTVIAPIPLFVGAMVTPRLTLQSPSGFRVDDRIKCPHDRLQAFGQGGDPTAIAATPTAPIRQTTTVRTSPSKGSWITSPRGTTVAQQPFSPVTQAGLRST
jgi:hypothetical protein